MFLVFEPEKVGERSRDAVRATYLFVCLYNALLQKDLWRPGRDRHSGKGNSLDLKKHMLASEEGNGNSLVESPGTRMKNCKLAIEEP